VFRLWSVDIYATQGSRFAARLPGKGYVEAQEKYNGRLRSIHNDENSNFGSTLTLEFGTEILDSVSICKGYDGGPYCQM
jgi:hypothetical protein